MLGIFDRVTILPRPSRAFQFTRYQDGTNYLSARDVVIAGMMAVTDSG